MSCCCKDPVFIGCFDNCNDIDTGFDAVQDGQHVIIVDVLPGSVQKIELTLTTGNSILIPELVLNEAKTQDFRIEQPDGTLYDFGDGTTCARLSTEITF